MFQQKDIASQRDQHHNEDDVPSLEGPFIKRCTNGVEHPCCNENGQRPSEEFQL